MGFKYQIYDQSKAYFLTFTVVQWVDIFSRKAYRDIIVESLKYCQSNKGLNIFAWVIMSNHMHLVVQSVKEDLSQVVCDFKKFTSKKIVETIKTGNESRQDWMLNLFSFEASKRKRNKDFQVWIQNSHSVEVYSNEFLRQKVEYIHYNPVRAGIVEKPEDYLYSSARDYAGLDCLIEVIKVDIYAE
ncbi:MAG: transposase [Bacteroidota bacterium]